MAEIIWSDEAERWLKDIHDYIAQDNPAAADKVVSSIYQRADNKCDPRRGGFLFNLFSCDPIMASSKSATAKKMFVAITGILLVQLLWRTSLWIHHYPNTRTISVRSKDMIPFSCANASALAVNPDLEITQ